MSKEFLGPQALLIEMVKLQMKMGEALSIANGRIGVLEATLEQMPMNTELKERFDQISSDSWAQHTSCNNQIKDQVQLVVSALERYMNG